MNYLRKSPKGFIGLLSLLIIAAIIALIAGQFYLRFPATQTQSSVSTAGVINRVQNAKQLLENQDKAAQESLH